MICRYCEIIHSFDVHYPLRKAHRDTKTDCPRCDWHWRFICSVCGRPRHFNGITWCEETRSFTCISCAKSHRVVRRKFWKWKYYYTIECAACGKRHPALDRLEFLGVHPWQLHPGMQTKIDGLDPTAEQEKLWRARRIHPLKKARISEEQISRAWDKVAEEWTRRYDEQGDINRRSIVDRRFFGLQARSRAYPYWMQDVETAISADC